MSRGPVFTSAGPLASSGSTASITPTIAPLNDQHGLFIAVCSIKSTSVITTATSGWVKLYQDNATGFTTAVFIAPGNSANPVFTWTGAVAAMAQVYFYDDPNNPVENTLVGATSVATGSGTTLTTASLNTTRRDSVVIYVSTVNNSTTNLGDVSGWTENVNTSNGTAGITFEVGSKQVATSGSASGAINQTSSVTGQWTQRQIELLLQNTPTGSWSVEVEFGGVSEISDGSKTAEFEFGAVAEISSGLRASEIEFGAVSQISDGARVAELEFVAVLIEGVEPENPPPAGQISKVRAFTFSLDGHDYYALRLGEEETLVFDLSTGEHTPWESFGRTVWRAHQGLNWLDISKTIYDDGVPSNVILGDDSRGILWSLDPTYGLDDSEDLGGNPTAYERVITTGFPLRMRNSIACDAVYVTVANGEPFTGQEAITLRTSDDNGKTWVNHGSVNLVPGEYSQEIAWRSLGLMRAPGRVFEISDTGATVRIDSVEMKYKGEQ